MSRLTKFALAGGLTMAGTGVAATTGCDTPTIESARKARLQDEACACRTTPNCSRTREETVAEFNRCRSIPLIEDTLRNIETEVHLILQDGETVPGDETIETEPNFAEVEQILLDGGVTEAQLAEYRANPNKPLPIEFWNIILTFLGIFGLALSLDLLALLMTDPESERYDSHGKALGWATLLGSMHAVFPELSGKTLGYVFENYVGLAGAAGFIWLVKNNFKLEEVKDKDVTTESDTETKNKSALATMVGLSIAVSADSFYAGPSIQDWALKLNVDSATASVLVGASVFMFALLGIALRPGYRKVLQKFQKTDGDTERYSKVAAVTVFSTLGCLAVFQTIVKVLNIPAETASTIELGALATLFAGLPTGYLCNRRHKEAEATEDEPASDGELTASEDEPASDGELTASKEESA